MPNVPMGGRPGTRMDAVRGGGVGGEEAGDALGDPAGGREVEELVGAVGVAAGHEHAGDDELGRREHRSEHAHERDRAALADRPGRLAEGGRRHLVERRRQPWRERGGVPPRRRLLVVERHGRAATVDRR